MNIKNALKQINENKISIYKVFKKSHEIHKDPLSWSTTWRIANCKAKHDERYDNVCKFIESVSACLHEHTIFTNEHNVKQKRGKK